MCKPAEDATKDTISLKGSLHLVGKDEDGQTVFEQTIDNLITNAGFNLIASLIGNPTQPSHITHLALGTGVAGGIGATALTTETHRQTCSFAYDAGLRRISFSSTFNNVAAVTEYGLFNAASAGTMLNTAGFAAITISSLIVTARITLS